MSRHTSPSIQVAENPPENLPVPTESLDDAMNTDKTGRNSPCPCGSGKKYKRCCIDKDERDQREQAAFDARERREQAATLLIKEALKHRGIEIRHDKHGR